jgi:hypothetical protein
MSNIGFLSNNLTIKVLFFLGLMAVLVSLFSKYLDFDTPISKLAILVSLFCQILKLHTSLFHFDDVMFFNIMWHLFI